MNETLSIRELENKDIETFASYWLNADASYLAAMGVDKNKLPTKEQFFLFWEVQLALPLEERSSYCVIWEKNNIPIGHSSTRPTHFGKDAYMHLHLWRKDQRGKGNGFELVQLTIEHYFERLRLTDLYCEPFALNPAPNRVLEKAGFELVKEHITNPGPSNFIQQVKLWRLKRDDYYS